MKTIMAMVKCWHLNVVFILAQLITGIVCTIDRLELVMPRYAIRGGDVILKCEHSVPPEQLYKVVWRKGHHKLFAYIKGRKPPFIYYPTAGGQLNKTHSSEKQIQLSKLDFSASGTYSCVVSMETPIFSKDSDDKDLTIIEPQDDDPIITFKKDIYEVGEILEANCTTAPAKPPPHITWLINGVKVEDKLTKSFSNGLIHGHGHFESIASSTKQLSIEVSELHVGEDGELLLTCMATIPGYVNNFENYADVRNKTVRINIEITEDPVAIANYNNSNNNISSSYKSTLNFVTFSVILVTHFYN